MPNATFFTASQNLCPMLYDVDLEQCTVKAVSCDVLLTSDSLAELEQYESIWYFVGRL